MDFYEAGADLGLATNLYDSFIIYQRKIAMEFKKMEKTYGLVPIDANRSIHEVNADLQPRIGGFLNAN